LRKRKQSKREHDWWRTVEMRNGIMGNSRMGEMGNCQWNEKEKTLEGIKRQMEKKGKDQG
jgi:hypothetical protein